MTDSTPLLQVNDVVLSFGGVQALKGVSFDIRKGEIRAVIGPNGAGKTAMLNVVNGFYRPNSGNLVFKGVTYSTMRPHIAAREGISRTFQNVALFHGMSTLDNIMTGRTLKMKTSLFWHILHRGPAEKEELKNREFVEHIISFLDIQHIRHTPTGKLPFGLQKRVELGRALASEPLVLLLDEPMAGMNVEEKEDMCRFIMNANEQFGTTIVMIEHDIGVVMDISDRILVMNYGEKLADGSPEEVRNNQAVIDAYLGTSHKEASHE